MFIFALGVTMSSYSVLSEYAGIIGKIELAVTSLADQSILQQYQLAEELFPVGIIFMVLGGIVGSIGASMKDESEEVNLWGRSEKKQWEQEN